jgi:WD40 repeat protein
MCDQDRLVQLVQDARRFIMYHKGAIEGYPLQIYAAALLFSPTGSLVRQLFRHEEPETISIRPALSDGWSACLQTLEGHSNWVRSVAFSHDSARLASASDDSTVKIWDAHSGACLQTLEGHSSPVWSVAFSHDSARLASASYDKTVKIWDAHSGACLQTLEGHSSPVSSVAFSHDSARLASASYDSTVKIWDAHSGACLQTLEGHSNWVRSVAFSHDSARLASASDDRTVKIWDAHSGACLQTLEGYSDAFGSADLVSILVSLHPDETAIEPQQPVSRGAAISLNRTWVSNNAQNMVWLPREYRPDTPACSAVSGRCVGIGTGSGKVWFCHFL